MKLYEYTMLIDSGFDPETGEIFDDSKLEQLQLERRDKLEAVACFYKDVDKFEDDVKEEINRLKKEIERCEKKKEWVKKYMAQNMALDERLDTVKCKVRFGHSEAVIVENVADLPPQFIQYKETFTPKKDDIKKAIDAGEEVTGAYIEHRYNLNIK